jgi:hypothetical protein
MVSKIKERIKNANSDTADKDTIISNEYNYEKDLNWKDDGDELGDASMNDYIKGYQIDPYAFKQWASNHKSFKKLAMNDQMYLMLQLSPEFLANEILTLWNGTDGQLQQFYEAFTLRYNNKLKKGVADILEGKGYKVYPVLTDDQPKYAKHKKLFKSIKASKNTRIAIEYVKSIFPNAEGLRKLAEEIDKTNKDGYNVTNEDGAALLDYYKLIYPEEYALSLVTIVVDEKVEEPGIQFEKFKDFDMSDETLDQIEEYMSGHADSYKRDGGVGGYDFISNSRPDGTAPNQYEVTSVKKKL